MRGLRLRPTLRYVALGIFFYAVFLIARAPAVWLADIATRLSNGAISLSNAHGTVWTGTAALDAGTPATGRRHLGEFQWHMQPWYLFLGQARFSLRLDGPIVRYKSEIGIVPRRRLNVADLEANFPASLVSLVYGPAAFFEPKGTIEVRATRAELSADGLNANIEAQWRGAGGRFTGPATLGDYRIQITGSGATATIRLSTLRGNLELNGQGEWHVTGDGTVRFTGSAAPKRDADRLEPLLRALGRDLGGGRRQIRLRTRLPLVEQLGL